ncbi:hypothetical protein, partial [Candidatus Nitrosotalea sp. FS]|uniref:hypothetical protein n=1 Tax=Candidatus Nitrosotalea sp. FS TaxID=2341021 RepID=UPI001C49B11A
MKIQKTKTKIVTVLASLIIGLTLVSPTMILSNVNAISLPRHIEAASPTLSQSESQAVSAAALAVPELQNWSHGWQYVHMAFLGNNKAGTPDFKWQYAIVDLKAPSSSAPVACDIDWWAWVEIDLTTKKVVYADYPSMASHICRGPAGSLGTSPGYSTVEQTDLNSGTISYYGNYAELRLPSFNTGIYSHLGSAYVEQWLNADFYPSSGCSTTECLEQGGWLITAYACSGCNISANTADIVYVDQSVHHNQQDYNTGLKWTNGASTTLYTEVDCAYTLPDYA